MTKSIKNIIKEELHKEGKRDSIITEKRMSISDDIKVDKQH